MCGRFNLSLTPTQVRYLDELGSPYPYPYGDTDEGNRQGDLLNIAPTEIVPVLASQRSIQHSIQSQPTQQAWLQARWWLVPSWSHGPDSQFAMFNARSETLHSSRAFKKPFESQRCIIPASSYLEWKKVTGGKKVIELYDNEMPLLFAGLWDKWLTAENQALYSCTIVTASAHPAIADIHSRMPVMLDLEGAKQWLAIESSKEDLNPLFTRYPTNLKHREVHPEIGNARNKIKPRPMQVAPKQPRLI